MNQEPGAKQLAVRSMWRLGLAAAATGTRLPGAGFARVADWLAGAGLLSRFALAAGAGVLAALAMAPFHLVPLVFVAFTMLVWLIDGLGQLERRLLSAAWIGWSFGLSYFGLGLFWIGNAFLVDAKNYGAMMPMAIGGLVAGLALFPALAIVLARLFWHVRPSRILVLALAWTAVEWLRGHVLSGFPWHLTAYVWGDTLAMLQPAALVGAYGLSLITVCAATAPAALADFSNGRAEPARIGALVWIFVAALLLGGTFGYGLLRLSAPPSSAVPGVRLRIVQPSVPQAQKLHSENAASIFKTHMDLTTRPGFDKITHVIWTEAAVPVMLGEEPAALAAIGALLGPKRWLIAGSARIEPAAGKAPDRYYNSLLVISGEGKVVAAYDKHHLVPFGEYLPLQWLLSRIGFKQLVESESGFTPGPGVRTLEVPAAPDMGALICYEAIFPAAVVDPHRRPGWLLNITDDTWFGHGVGPRQHYEIARVRAIEEGLPFVRAANNGISAVLDARGRVLRELGFDAVGTLDSELPVAEPLTPYGRLGDLTFAVLWLLTALVSLTSRNRGGHGEL